MSFGNVMTSGSLERPLSCKTKLKLTHGPLNQKKTLCMRLVYPFTINFHALQGIGVVETRVSAKTKGPTTPPNRLPKLSFSFGFFFLGFSSFFLVLVFDFVLGQPVVQQKAPARVL